MPGAHRAVRATKFREDPGWKSSWGAGDLALDIAGHREDRQVHGDDHAADDNAQKDHHQRLEHRGEVVDGDVDLFFIEVGNFCEHDVEGTGRLTHADHLNDHGWEDAGLHEWIDHILALADALAHIHDGLLDGHIAENIGDD